MQTHAHDPSRDDLVDAVAFARQRVEAATEAYEQGGRTLALLRKKQVAEDELKALAGERHQYDDDRDVGALYRDERRGHCTGRTGWPQGGQWTPPKRDYVVSRTVHVERVVNAASTAPAPAKKDKTSWWVGADRRQLNIGARALAQSHEKKPRPNAKGTIRKIEDQKRFETKGSKAAAELQQRLQPMAGEFTTIPMPE